VMHAQPTEKNGAHANGDPQARIFRGLKGHNLQRLGERRNASTCRCFPGVIKNVLVFRRRRDAYLVAAVGARMFHTCGGLIGLQVPRTIWTRIVNQEYDSSKRQPLCHPPHLLSGSYDPRSARTGKSNFFLNSLDGPGMSLYSIT
jgi:hypothetical protein